MLISRGLAGLSGGSEGGGQVVQAFQRGWPAGAGRIRPPSGAARPPSRETLSPRATGPRSSGTHVDLTRSRAGPGPFRSGLRQDRPRGIEPLIPDETERAKAVHQRDLRGQVRAPGRSPGRGPGPGHAPLCLTYRTVARTGPPSPRPPRRARRGTCAEALARPIRSVEDGEGAPAAPLESPASTLWTSDMATRRRDSCDGGIPLVPGLPSCAMENVVAPSRVTRMTSAAVTPTRFRRTNLRGPVAPRVGARAHRLVIQVASKIVRQRPDRRVTLLWALLERLATMLSRSPAYIRRSRWGWRRAAGPRWPRPRPPLVRPTLGHGAQPWRLGFDQPREPVGRRPPGQRRRVDARRAAGRAARRARRRRSRW